MRITGMEVVDVRFPTSAEQHGSDAMHSDPDYSAAYVVLRTDGAAEGYGLTFTVGRGTEVVVSAVEALREFVVGLDVDHLRGDLRAFWRTLTRDSQLRWIGPEKGAAHLAVAAIVNAVWDLLARVDGKPLWKYLVDLPPADLVATLDLSYLSDVLTPADALDLLSERQRGRAGREASIVASGYPAYVTSVGWLGYPEDKIAALCAGAVADGWDMVKMKVGADPAVDTRRAEVIRGAVGPDLRLGMDANQVWDVEEAIARVRDLARFDPYWIEEPTSPDDVLGHARIAREIAPIPVATGEHCHNRVMFKQLFQAKAIGFCQIDACRLGGVNEVLAVLLMAAKFGIPVCPHAGGVGLCEYVQHLSVFDYVAVSGSLDERRIEWADHLHEHFTDPAVARGGRYVVPTAPGYSVQMHPESVRRFAFPNGEYWSSIGVR
jgi:L-fuconate dehydratase